MGTQKTGTFRLYHELTIYQNALCLEWPSGIGGILLTNTGLDGMGGGEGQLDAEETSKDAFQGYRVGKDVECLLQLL